MYEKISDLILFNFSHFSQAQKSNGFEVFWNKNIGSVDKEKAIFAIQKKLKCCGTDGYESWSHWAHPIPGSCCGKKDEKQCDPAELKGTPGCIKKLKSVFNITYFGLFGSSLLIILIELLTAVLAAKQLLTKKQDNRNSNQNNNRINPQRTATHNNNRNNNNSNHEIVPTAPGFDDNYCNSVYDNNSYAINNYSSNNSNDVFSG